MRVDVPSQTAVRICRGLVFLGKTEPYATLLPEGAGRWAERLGVASGVLTPWMSQVYRSRWYDRLTSALDRRLMPGQLLGSTLRKRFVDDRVRAAIEDGADQVLVIGAGLDTLAARLAPAHPAVSFTELDHPSTLRVKRAGLERLNALPDNLELESADLSRRTLEDALERTGFAPGAPSAVVAEGLLMYLSEAAVRALLDSLHALTAPGSALIATFLDDRPSWILARSLELMGEPVRWTIAPDAVRGLFADHGFSIVEGSADLRSTYLAGTPLAAAPLSSSEHVAAAIRE